MDIKIASELLDRLPISRSNYEFKNFFVEKYNTFPRQLRAVLLEKERLNDDVILANTDLEMLNLEIESSSQAGEHGSIIARRNEAKINQFRRKIDDLEKQLKQVDDWLSSYSIDECRNAILEFEQTEGDYWTEELGKQSAIELLSIDHVRRETMAKLNELPLSDYKKAVIITAQLSTFIKETTMIAESTVFPQQSKSIPSGDTDPTTQKQSV